MSEIRDQRSPAVIIAGPTGSGKSALAVALGRAFFGTVINADSMQVYRDLRILSARPTEAEQQGVPHRLFGILPAAEACSAGRWLRLAIPEIAAAHAAGRLPILVGGTGLYLKALTDGLAPVPQVPPEMVAEARTLHAGLGGERFKAALAELDPDGAERIRASDTQRLVRAYAVARATGRPLGLWQRAAGSELPASVRFLTIALLPSPADLSPALDARFAAMMAEGALTEVRALAALGLAPDLPAMKAVGVRELLACLRGETTIEGAVGRAQQATRQFAKRQRTWIRHQIVPDSLFEVRYSDDLWLRINGLVENFLARPEAPSERKNLK